MMAAPPSEAGGLQDRVTRPLPAVADSPVGGPGFRIRACGSRTAVRTTETPGPSPPAALPAGGPARARPAGAGCPGTAAGLHLLARRKGIMRSPGGEATRCHED